MGLLFDLEALGVFLACFNLSVTVLTSYCKTSHISCFDSFGRKHCQILTKVGYLQHWCMPLIMEFLYLWQWRPSLGVKTRIRHIWTIVQLKGRGISPVTGQDLTVERNADAVM